MRSTSSRSPSRSRPLSTKMQVSWSPIARCTSAAATDESTPPRQPADRAARRRPARARARPRRRRTRPSSIGRQPQMPSTKLREQLARRRRCAPPRGGTARPRAVARGGAPRRTASSSLVAITLEARRQRAARDRRGSSRRCARAAPPSPRTAGRARSSLQQRAPVLARRRPSRPRRRAGMHISCMP